MTTGTTFAIAPSDFSAKFEQLKEVDVEKQATEVKKGSKNNKNSLIFFNQYDPDSTLAAIMDKQYQEAMNNNLGTTKYIHYNRFQPLDTTGYDFVAFYGIDLTEPEMQAVSSKDTIIYYAPQPGYNKHPSKNLTTTVISSYRVGDLKPEVIIDNQTVFDTVGDPIQNWIASHSVSLNMASILQRFSEKEGFDLAKSFEPYNVSNVLNSAYFLPMGISDKKQSSRDMIAERLDEKIRVWNQHKAFAERLLKGKLSPVAEDAYRSNFVEMRNLLMNTKREYTIRRKKTFYKVACFPTTEANYRDMFYSALMLNKNVIGYEDTKWGRVWRFFSHDWITTGPLGGNFFDGFPVKALWMESAVSCALSELEKDFMK